MTGTTASNAEVASSPATVTVAVQGADASGISASLAALVADRTRVSSVSLVPDSAGVGALALGPAAARSHGVVLTTQGSYLSAAVANELNALQPSCVYILDTDPDVGGSLLAGVQEVLGRGESVYRIPDQDPAEVAAYAAGLIFGGPVDSVVVASSDGRDGLAASATAAALGVPLLFASPNELPASTSLELSLLRPGRAFVVGAASDVSDAVVDRIRTQIPQVERIAGADEAATAGVLATRFFPAGGQAIGMSGPDQPGALAAVPLAALGIPMLFAGTDELMPDSTREALRSLRPDRVYLVGATPDLMRGQWIGFSDGTILISTDTATYPPGDTGFHDPAELETVIQATQAAFPDLVQVFSIGKSYEGRDIWMARVSDNVSIDEGEPEVLVDALHHASEHLGVEQALYLLHTLTSDYASDPYVHRLVDSRVVWIVFAVNPDGWVYDLSGNPYNYWRKNMQPSSPYHVGTDLNRNYPYMWGCCQALEASSDLPYAYDYRGPYPLSAPESRALADFVASRVIDGRQRIRTHVSLHTDGEMVLYPMSYTFDPNPMEIPADDLAVFKTMALTMASLNGYTPMQSSLLYPTDGDEIDFLYDTYRIFSFDFELYPTETVAGKKGIYYPPDTIIARETARNRTALLYLIDAAACPYEAIGKQSLYCDQ